MWSVFKLETCTVLKMYVQWFSRYCMPNRPDHTHDHTTTDGQLVIVSANKNCLNNNGIVFKCTYRTLKHPCRCAEVETGFILS